MSSQRRFRIGRDILLQSIFYDARRYDMAKVGRYKMNKKLGSQLPLTARTLTGRPVQHPALYHQSQRWRRHDRRHRPPGRTSASAAWGTALLATAHGLFADGEGRQRAHDQPGQRQYHPQVILSVKPISASIKSFSAPRSCRSYGSDQPAGGTDGQTARLRARPGGCRDRAPRLEVRDVHESHYGRICPIETPEGPTSV